MLNREYRIWFILFILINVWAVRIIIGKGELIGDLDGIRLASSNNLFFALGLVILSYFLILVFGFNYFTRIKIPRVIKMPQLLNLRAKNIISFLILLFQFSFLIFNIAEGINVAGSLNVKSNSVLSFFWVFLPVDTIFYIYYVTFRKEKYLKINLIVFVISNLMRGWSGFFLILLFLEWCHRFRNKTLNYFRLVIFSVVVLLIYPYLLNVKWAIRASKANDIELSTSADMLEGMIESKSYYELLEDGIEQIVGRLQITAILTEVINKRDVFRSGFENDKFVSYYGEGFIQIAYRRITGQKSTPNIGSIAPNYLRSDNPYELDAYNLSVGLMSWLIILPTQFPFYIIYIYFLCYLSVFFVKQMNFSTEVNDLIWMSWFFLLVVGWISQFITFIYSILVFLIIIKISFFLARLKFHDK